MFKRRISFITALIFVGILLISLSGCSRARSAKQPTLEFWCYMSGGSNDQTGPYWRKVAEGFEKANPGVKVNIVSDISHEYYMSMLGTRFIGHNAPDVMIMDDVEIPELAREGLITPLERFIRSSKCYRSSDFAPSMVSDSRIDDVRFSVPWSGALLHLTYRKDLLAKVGARPPRTWGELIQVCQKLQQKLGMKYPFGMDVNGSFWTIDWVWQNGGEVFSPDYTRVIFDEPQAVEAIQFIHDLAYKYRVMDPGLASGTKMQDLWSAGKIAMMMDGTFVVGRYDTLFPQWKGKWELAPLPAGTNDVSFYGGAHLVMSSQSRNPKLAWRFVEYATSEKNQLMFANATGNPPSNIRVFDMPEFREKNSHIAALRASIRHGRNTPLVPYWSKIWYEIFPNRVLDVVMKDPNADIAKAMHSAAVESQKAVDDYLNAHPELKQQKGKK